MHLGGVTKESRDRIIEFIDFMEEASAQSGEIDKFVADRDFLALAGFVRAMHNLGFKKANA